MKTPPSCWKTEAGISGTNNFDTETEFPAKNSWKLDQLFMTRKPIANFMNKNTRYNQPKGPKIVFPNDREIDAGQKIAEELPTPPTTFKKPIETD